MNDEQELERAFRQVPPKIVEGPHREQLRQELLGLMISAAQGKEHTMSGWRLTRSSRWFKAAAACLVAAALMGTGWAAEKVYEKVRKTYFVNIPSREPLMHYEIATPDGKKIGMFSAEGIVVSGVGSGELDANQVLQQAKRAQEEIKALIKSKKYECVKTFETPGAETQYVYIFTLSDGQKHAQNFGYPLEKVASWEDYLQKVQKQRQERQERITAAIANGRFRLLDIDLIKQHICRDAETAQMLSVMEHRLPDGEHVAKVDSYPLEKSQGGYQTSWQDHLNAIKEGKRELVKVMVTNRYVYEITLDDGSKAIFSYGGEEPLSKGEKTSATTPPAGG